MKILNRPMFRMGGPIKEGIMNGIQEPKRGRVDGPGSYSGEAEIFANVEKTYVPPNFENQIKANQIKDSQIINRDYLQKKFDKEYLLNEGQRIETDPSSFQFQQMTPKRYINEVDKLKRDEIISNPEAKNYFFDKFVTENYADKIQKQKSLFEAADDSRLNKTYGNERLVGTSAAPGGGDPEMYAKPNTVEKVIEKKEVIEENPEANRKKSINNILEKLGYARSQKNALYDALIAGGQRISREGLGKTNLVNDLIADTSTAYDKPEKIREAAELMQVQQDLKLEGIDRSKDNRGTVQKTIEYFMSKDGGDHSRADALALAKNQAIDAHGIFTEAKAKGTTTEAVDFTASKMAKAGRFGEGNVYKNRIDTKYKGSSGLIEFMESGSYNGDGVYTRGGEILLLKDGKVTSLVRFKGTGKTGFFGGEKE